KDVALTFTFSCYLIRHGDEYMVWDTGFAPGSSPNAPKVSIVERLAEVKVKPEQVKYVGISHFHADHTGQLAPFANAMLPIGEGGSGSQADMGHRLAGGHQLDARVCYILSTKYRLANYGAAR